MSLTLKRVAILPQGAFGVLLWYGIPFAVSLERTYDGQRGTQRTKIVPGSYKCTRGRYNRGGYDTWEIEVQGHTEIKFHKGNVEEELEGCVAVGEQYGLLNGKTAILQSGAAFHEFMTLTADQDEFYMAVVNC